MKLSGGVVCCVVLLYGFFSIGVMVCVVIDYLLFVYFLFVWLDLVICCVLVVDMVLFGLFGGCLLFKVGELVDVLYLLVSGSLGVFDGLIMFV